MGTITRTVTFKKIKDGGDQYPSVRLKDCWRDEFGLD